MALVANHADEARTAYSEAGEFTDYVLFGRDHSPVAVVEANGLPTFVFPYETAVQEDYLADYRVLSAQARF